MKNKDECKGKKLRRLCLGSAAALLLFCAGCGTKASGAHEVELEKPLRAEEAERDGAPHSGLVISDGQARSDGRIHSGVRVPSDERIPSGGRVFSDGRPGEASGRPEPGGPGGRGERLEGMPGGPGGAMPPPGAQ